MVRMPFDSDDILRARRLKALGHPARLAIVRGLMQANRCSCGDIVRNLPLAQSTVSQHLKVLREAGLIRGEIEGPRSCYWVDAGALREIAATVEGLAAPARELAGAA